MTTVAIYARSGVAQRPERSIEEQERSCRAKAAAEGWTIVDVRSDLAGAGPALRPGLEALLARAGDFDLILAETTDRLSRSVADMATIRERLALSGTRLVTVMDGGTGDTPPEMAIEAR